MSCWVRLARTSRIEAGARTLLTALRMAVLVVALEMREASSMFTSRLILLSPSVIRGPSWIFSCESRPARRCWWWWGLLLLQRRRVSREGTSLAGGLVSGQGVAVEVVLAKGGGAGAGPAGRASSCSTRDLVPWSSVWRCWTSLERFSTWLTIMHIAEVVGSGVSSTSLGLGGGGVVLVFGRLVWEAGFLAYRKWGGRYPHWGRDRWAGSGDGDGRGALSFGIWGPFVGAGVKGEATWERGGYRE